MIQKEMTIDAPSNLVWQAWTVSGRITQWFAPSAVIEPIVGGKFELYFNPENTDSMGTKGCKIISLIEGSLLEFEWKGPDLFAETMNTGSELTRVTVELSGVNNRTNLVLKHEGWGETEEWNKAKEWHHMAWEQMLASLKSKLEAGTGNLCCQ